MRNDQFLQFLQIFWAINQSYLFEKNLKNLERFGKKSLDSSSAFQYLCTKFQNCRFLLKINNRTRFCYDISIVTQTYC